MTVPEDKIPVIDDRRDSGPGGPPGLSDERIDELLSGATTANEITGPNGLLARLTKRWSSVRWTPS